MGVCKDTPKSCMSWSFVLHNDSIMQIISEFILISPDSVPVWILPSCSHPRFVLCLPASLQMSFCCTVWTRKFHATPTILLVHTHSPHHHPEKLCQQLTNGELMMPRTLTTSHLNSTAYHGDNIQHYLWNLRRFTHQSPAFCTPTLRVRWLIRISARLLPNRTIRHGHN